MSRKTLILEPNTEDKLKKLGQRIKKARLRRNIRAEIISQQAGIADTSKGGRYHNKNFKREAELRDLSISYQQYIGYSVTKPTDAFITVLKTHGIEKPLDINRDGEQIGFSGIPIGILGIDGMNGITGTDLGTDKKKTSTRKYECPCCGNSFRATKDIRVLCIECNEEFIKVEKK